MHLSDEVLQHFFGHVEVGNDAVFQRANGLDVTWRTTQHTLCIFTHRRNGFLVALLANRHHRGFIQDNPFAAGIDQGVRGSKVDRKIV